jgi:DNA polymerase III subunit alpha
VHFTAEFFAANMTIEMGDTDKLKVLLNDAVKNFKLSFEPPNVNSGVHRFEPMPGAAGRKQIRYGLGAIKGTGQGAIEAMVAAREADGPFTSLFNFCGRIDKAKVNKRVVEALIKAGAFDTLHPDRASALASVGLAFDWAETQQANANQGGLFDFDDGDSHGSHTNEPPLVAAEPWSVREKLGLEKTALGFFMSGHLFDQDEAEVRQFCKRRVADLIDSREPQLLAGIISDLRIVNGQRGRVGIFKVDDNSEPIEAVANEELLDANKDLLRDDELVIVQGKVQPDRFSGGLRLNVAQVWSLAAARARFGRHLAVVLNGAPPPLADLVRAFPAHVEAAEQGDLVQGLAVRLRIERPTAVADIDLGDKGRFWPSDEALAAWAAMAPAGKVRIVYESV